MDDLMKGLQSVLNDEQALAQISELAKCSRAAAILRPQAKTAAVAALRSFPRSLAAMHKMITVTAARAE